MLIFDAYLAFWERFRDHLDDHIMYWPNRVSYYFRIPFLNLKSKC